MHHQSIGHHAQDGATGEDDDSTKRGIARNHFGLEAQEQEHQPWRCNCHSGTVDGPRLSGLKLRSGAGIITKIAREVAEQPAQISATNFTGNPKRLDHPISNRIRQSIL